MYNKAAPWKERVSLLERTVRPAIFWAASSWLLSAKQLDKLKATQNQMMRKMLRLKKDPGESVGDFVHRGNSILCNLKKLHQTTPWDQVAHGYNFSWAGHLARFTQWSPHRIALRVLHWRNWKYLQRLQASEGSQCHGRRLRIWRWERGFYKFWQDWEQAAKDKQSWEKYRDAWILWRTYER